MNNIPVTVVTGYLGSGKTTIILNLIKQLKDDYKVVWLKNEYGNLSVDSELARENNIAVKEMLNGCLCCVLVGKLHDALDEILRTYSPDRIIVESSGTAYPMPIVFEIKRIPALTLDGVINVVDAVNFSGYHDKGYVAKMQSDYTDLIVINKVGLVDENRLDAVLDEVYELNPNTPKIKTTDGNLSKDLLLGLDTKLLEVSETEYYQANPQDDSNHDHDHHPDSVDVFVVESDAKFDTAKLEAVLSELKNREFIRIKGVVATEQGYQLLNWVFGRLVWQELTKYSGATKITFMGRDTEGLENMVREKILACALV
jgi:G3E family GTPase